MISIKKISTDKEFFKLKKNWNILLEKSENKNIFLTWEWLYTWWKTFKTKKKLNILLAYEETDLVGIAPIYSKKESQTFMLFP